MTFVELLLLTERDILKFTNRSGTEKYACVVKTQFVGTVQYKIRGEKIWSPSGESFGTHVSFTCTFTLECLQHRITVATHIMLLRPNGRPLWSDCSRRPGSGVRGITVRVRSTRRRYLHADAIVRRTRASDKRAVSQRRCRVHGPYRLYALRLSLVRPTTASTIHRRQRFIAAIITRHKRRSVTRVTYTRAVLAAREYFGNRRRFLLLLLHCSRKS